MMKVLVCEDDLITLRALEYSLRKAGYDVYTACDGQKGMEMLRNNPGIDIMITDQHMPYFSGLELVHLARNELKLDVPIIMLTRVSHEETKKLAMSLGVNEYMTKPFFPRQLLLKIEGMLNGQK